MKIYIRMIQALRTAGLAVLLTSASHCMDVEQNPLDTSQGGLSGFLGLIYRALTTSSNATSETTVRLITVGPAGKTYTSTDRLTWTTGTITPAVDFYSILYTGTRWIATGGFSDGTTCDIYHSTDAQTWSQASHPACTGFLTDVANGGGKLVAVGRSNAGTPQAMVSNDDGLSWTTLATAGTYRYDFVVYTGSTFMAANNAQTAALSNTYTSDGSATFAITTAPQSAAKENTVSMLYMVGSQIVHVATDPCCFPPTAVRSVYSINNGSTWTLNAVDIFGGNTANEYPRAIIADSATAPTVLVAVGDACRVDRTAVIGTLSWSGSLTMNGCSSVNWTGLVHDGTKYVAVGNVGGVTASVAVSATGNATDWVITSLGSNLVNRLGMRP
ncbi:MAG: hypothetical protein KDK39_06800 [Leptospiraceae bacterium]|nr:hypothetical protein [Leptospiraceae bacterium]